MFGPLMAHLRVARGGPGRPRTRPQRVRADKAYSSRAIRAHLRARAITAVIPEKNDQAGHRARRGTHGGRPPSFNAEDYRGRNVVVRSFNVALALSLLRLSSAHLRLGFAERSWVRSAKLYH